MGKTGMGYFYLRLNDPMVTASILAPKLSVEAPLITDADRYPNITMLQPELERSIIHKTFPMTFDLLANVEPDNLIDFLIDEHPQPTDSFINLIKEISPSIPQSTQQRVKDVFQLENTKRQVVQNVRSNAFLHIQEVIQSEKVSILLQNKDTTSFLNQPLQLADDVTILNAQWNWQATKKLTDTLHIAAEEYPILLKPTATNLIEVALNPFSYSILNAFRNSNTSQDALEKIQSYFVDKALDNTTQQQIEKYTIYQASVDEIKHF